MSALIAASYRSYIITTATCEITLRVGIHFNNSSPEGTYNPYTSYTIDIQYSISFIQQT